MRNLRLTRELRSAVLLALLGFLSVLGILTLFPTQAASAGCDFVLGFKLLHDLIPGTVGDCRANVHYNPQNGDALQETIAWHGNGGLLVWRKSDNWTAFTDGARTWVNGPYGLQQRLNTERFSWEQDVLSPQSQRPEFSEPARNRASSLENDASKWGIWIDKQGLPKCQTAYWDKHNISDPSRDGKALLLAIRGDDCYTHVHSRFDLPYDALASRLDLSLWYRFSQTTWNNEGNPSVIQALEFAANKWEGSKRYECAIQWENVGDGGAEQGRPPSWRVWDAANGVWRDTGITQRLDGGTWHRLDLGCELRDGRVNYTRFASDAISSPLGQRYFPQHIDMPPDRLSVTIQLDGNFRNDPYEVIVDQVSLDW